MSQNPNQDLPGWVVAIVTALAAIAIPAVIWVTKKVVGSILHDEFKEYLQGRDKLSEDRHNENLANFRTVAKGLTDLGERVSHVEGAMSGTYRRPP